LMRPAGQSQSLEFFFRQSVNFGLMKSSIRIASLITEDVKQAKPNALVT
jgi:hypothetical protein